MPTGQASNQADCGSCPGSGLYTDSGLGLTKAVFYCTRLTWLSSALGLALLCFIYVYIFPWKLVELCSPQIHIPYVESLPPNVLVFRDGVFGR